MPLQRCSKSGKTGWKWGQRGHCYVGPGARAKAARQAAAIHASGYVGNAANPLRIDPTRTATLRKRFIAELRRRFERLRRKIVKLVVEDDSFGLGRRRRSIFAGNEAWQFQSNPQKVQAFESWLRAQYGQDMLSASSQEVYQRYIQEGMQRGVARAFDDTRGAGLGSSDSLDFYAGTQQQFLQSAFRQPVSVETLQMLTARTFTDLRGVTETMAARMTNVLADGLVQGLSPHEVAANLSDALGISRSRAETIARTELIRSFAEGQLLAFRELGVAELGVMVEWITAGNACLLCAANAGIRVKIEDAGGRIPLHPNAVFGSSTFVSYGECQELVRAWYRGPSVVLTLGSGEYGTTIGPNHPMMTRRGMVPAAQLREGDEILYDLRNDFPPCGLDHEEVPATVKDVFEASLCVSGHSGIIASTSDLHGDRVFCQGEVQGIRPARNLLRVWDSCSIEKLRQDNFARSYSQLSFLAGGSSGQLTLQGVNLSPSGFVGCRHLDLSLSFGHPAPLQDFGFASSSQLDVVQEQAAIYRGIGYSEESSNGNGRLSGKIAIHDFFVWRKVHGVSFAHYEGWAFDATTATSLYCSDGLVVSNCRCAWAPIVPSTQPGKGTGQGPGGLVEPLPPKPPRKPRAPRKPRVRVPVPPSPPPPSPPPLQPIGVARQDIAAAIQRAGGDIDAQFAALDQFLSDSQPAGPMREHGMAQPEVMRRVVIDGVEVFYPDTPTGREQVKGFLINLGYQGLSGQGNFPPGLWEINKQIIFSSQESVNNAYWQRVFNDPAQIGAAEAGNGRVVVFGGRALSMSTLTHETGHNLAEQLWGQAMQATAGSLYDLASIQEGPVTPYGARSKAEDFAEAVKLYVGSPVQFRQDFPQKAAALDDIMRGLRP